MKLKNNIENKFHFFLDMAFPYAILTTLITLICLTWCFCWWCQ